MGRRGSQLSGYDAGPVQIRVLGATCAWSSTIADDDDDDDEDEDELDDDKEV
jgi:hypothetical protein